MSPKNHASTTAHASDTDEPRTGSTRAAKKNAARAGGAEATLLMLLGLSCTLGGLALSILPRFSWKAAQIMVGFDYLGIHGGAVAVGGMVLLGLGLVARRQGSREESSAPESDGPGAQLLLEQIAADVLQMRGSMDELEGQQAALRSGLAGVGTELAALRAVNQNEAPRGGSEDALFGLATSLDKLGLKLEMRLKAQHQALQDSLEEMNATFLHARQAIEEKLDAAATAPASQSTAPAVAPEDAPADASSLGVLDSLDDYGAALPGRAASAGIDLEQLELAQRALEHEAPARGASWEEELQLVEASAPRTKLDQLQSLLADEEVRAVLASLRRPS
jgi:hypothetical protein